MRLSYNAVWDDLVSQFKAHAELILVVAGVFIFIPSLAQALFVPPPEITSFTVEAAEQVIAYFQDNAAALILFSIPISLGNAALLALVLDPARLTVAGAIQSAARLLISFVALGLIMRVLISFGMFAFVLPGLYIWARILLAEPAMMAERLNNPLTALSRSLTLTRGNSLAVLGMLIIVCVLTWLLTTVASALIGLLSLALLSAGGAEIVKHLMAAISASVFAIVLTLLSASFYRAVSGAGASKGI
jgi:hypothetical protein